MCIGKLCCCPIKYQNPPQIDIITYYEEKYGTKAFTARDDFIVKYDMILKENGIKKIEHRVDEIYIENVISVEKIKMTTAEKRD